MPDLTIIQKTYNLIKWYVPILNRLPKDHKGASTFGRYAFLFLSFPRRHRIQEVSDE
jgi:hypothetical protein